MPVLDALCEGTGDAMTIEGLGRARAEALRFLATVKALESRRQVEEAVRAKDKAAGREFSMGLYAFQGCRESGAVRRASLDLTRALADLRRS